MTVWIADRQRAASVPAGPLKALARKILARLKRPEAGLSLVLVDDRQIRRLNREYRGKDSATDVLAFPLNISSSLKGPKAPPPFLGDVVISLETARRQAEERGRRLSEEVGWLLIHGVLHLLGFDHEEEREARRMRRKERALIRELLDA